MLHNRFCDFFALLCGSRHFSLILASKRYTHKKHTFKPSCCLDNTCVCWELAVSTQITRLCVLGYEKKMSTTTTTNGLATFSSSFPTWADWQLSESFPFFSFPLRRLTTHKYMHICLRPSMMFFFEKREKTGQSLPQVEEMENILTEACS